MREIIVAISLLTLVASTGCRGGKTSLTATRLPEAKSTSTLPTKPEAKSTPDPPAKPEAESMPTWPEKAGIPIQLTKPEFTLTESPPSDKNPNTSYTINLLYRPDPAQRFLINIDPASLHEGDLKLSLGKQGQLRQVNTETREQLTPQIKAIGTFVAGAIGTVAKFAALDLSSEFARIFARVNKKGFKVYTAGLEGDYVPEERDFRDSTPDEKDGLEKLKERLESLGMTKEILAKFYPRTEQEILWLRTARALARLEADSAKKKNDYDTKKKEFFDKVKPEQNDYDQIDLAIRAGNSERLERLEKEQLDRVKEDQTKRTAIDAFFKVAKQCADPNRDVALFDKLLNLPDRDWRNRHAEYLEGLIAGLEQEAIWNKNFPPAKQDKLKELREQWAQTVKVVEEQKRADMLKNFLKEQWYKADVALPSSTLQSPAFNNYEIARKEYEAVLTTIQQKRSALKPSAEAPKLVQRELRPKELWFTKNGKSNSEWVNKDGKSNAEWVKGQVNKDNPLPEFVIVIEKGTQR